MRTLLLATCLLLAILPKARAAAWTDPGLLQGEGPSAALLQLKETATVDGGDASGDTARGVRVPFAQRVAQQVADLQGRARASQAPLLAQLRAEGIPHRAFWVANVVRVEATPEQLRRLAARAEVDAILADRPRTTRLPQPEPALRAPAAVEWGVARVRAPEVWALGFRGQGVVVGGQDTGYDWDHPALRNAYRGWNGSSVDHDHNWRDAIVAGGANDCGLASPEPCDDHNHGTHTMGTVVGDDGAGNQVGVAPAARWIGCRNMNAGSGTPSTYLDCFEWFLAPTAVDGSDPRPDLAPHVLVNSWGCPPSEGCVDAGILEEAVDNVHDAGILVVASAGNAGPACNTVLGPPAIYGSALSVGATTSTDAIASFSSRGPTPDGLLKPDLSAPGASIRSSIRNGAYSSFSGTSMAGPHVAGVAALAMSAAPSLIGNPDRLAALLRSTAIPTLSAQTCGAFPGLSVPNAVFGHGRVDALALVHAALQDTPVFDDGFEDP